jgi:SAM-dependent methyltransferase
MRWRKRLRPGEVKFSRKLTKLALPLTYRRTWRRVQRWLHPIRLQPLLAQIDHERLRAIQAQYASSSGHYAKYLEVEPQLKLNIQRVQDLKLHLSPPQEVLDIGSGGGFFLFIAKQFGHGCLGLDTDEFPVFGELTQLFGVPRKIWTIRAFEPLPDLGRKFDRITAFSTAFQGRHMHSWQWGPEEWRFFLDDLNRHLKPGGRIFFALNPAYAARYYTPEILDFFLSRGATVERENVLFPARK